MRTTTSVSIARLPLPSRAEQDDLAETIRIARVIARETIASAGGVGFAAYLGALQAMAAPPKVPVFSQSGASAIAVGTPLLSPVGEVTFIRRVNAKGEPAPRGLSSEVEGADGARSVVANSELALAVPRVRESLRGGRGRPAMGSATLEALRLFAVGDGVGAAALDLDCDPGCRAIDAARDVLIEVLAAKTATADDRQAREAIRDFDREVCKAAAALRGILPLMARRHRRSWGPSTLTQDEAEAAAMDGLLKACAVYRRGEDDDASLSTYAQNHGWIFKAIREAEPMKPTKVLLFNKHSHGTEEHKHEASLRLPSPEDQAIEAEQTAAASAHLRALLEAGTAEMLGKQTATARGIRAFAADEMPPRYEMTPALTYLRGMHRRIVAPRPLWPAL